MLTFERAGGLVTQLIADPSSALFRAADPEEAAYRGLTSHILADLYDALVHGKAKTTRASSEKRYPRPGDAQAALEAEQAEQEAQDRRRAALLAQKERIRARELAERGDGG